MPCIQTKVNIPISKEKEEILKAKLGEAISMLPGKSERWLMLTFEDQCRMWFQGEKEKPMAFVEVKVYGGADAKAYSRLTGEITKILGGELGIAPGEIYIKYEETKYWGFNGSNF